MQNFLLAYRLCRPSCLSSKDAPLCGAAPPGLAEPHLAEAAAQPVSARDGQLYGVDREALAIRGVNWFGFETSVTAVHGLWQVRSLFWHPVSLQRCPHPCPPPLLIPAKAAACSPFRLHLLPAAPCA